MTVSGIEYVEASLNIKSASCIVTTRSRSSDAEGLELWVSDGTEIGTGWPNTNDILYDCYQENPKTAAMLCNENGWFLPSRDELALLLKVGYIKYSFRPLPPCLFRSQVD